MDKLKEHIVNGLRESRAELLNYNKSQLNGKQIWAWYQKWKNILIQSDASSGHLLPTNIEFKMNGFWNIQDPDLCIELRGKIVMLIDNVVKAVDSKQNVRPVLEELILKIANTKLSTLLIEFNSARINQPNLACAGFRTILPLIIRERAKIVDSTSELATKGDIGFEPDLKLAIGNPSIFNSAERKLISRYLHGGDKDSFDNVVHKPDYLINKDELDDAVTLLNHLLPSII